MPAERLVYHHVSGPKLHATVSFADVGGKTVVTVRMLFDTAAERDYTAKQFGAVEGLQQTLGRLAGYVAKSLFCRYLRGCRLAGLPFDVSV